MTLLKVCLVILILTGGFGEAVSADESIRCNGRLVSIGAVAEEVRDICGPPDRRKAWETHPQSDISRFFDYETGSYRLPRFIKGPLHMERWIYHMGSNRFSRILDFENGTLIRIRTGPKEDAG